MKCPDIGELSLYLDDRGLELARKKQIESHIAECDRCMDMLLVAFRSTQKPISRRKDLITKIRKRLNFPERKFKINWLMCSVVMFALSFVLKKYFIQFLFASLLLGFKWVMEGEGARKVVMIFKELGKEKETIRETEKRTSRSP